jgi:hypothetical protein
MKLTLVPVPLHGREIFSGRGKAVSGVLLSFQKGKSVGQSG